ncbi:Uncharacterised protein [Rhodococcus gordoniae]|uniref:Uncharacterized protein n=1 Tax=Rhodococcus gordoniae TaxID=223392 RepID=A0A379M3H9_9NOCA|nr:MULTISPECIES: hypothetical protein [Rhodococcus]SUE16871.1 Uncharacterised protein [Rhodococcus gordoniae]
MSAPTEQPIDDPTRELFRTALDMAQAAKVGNVSGWLTARYESGRLEDVAFLLSQMLGVLIENGAVSRGVHPADAWRELREGGVDDFG